MTLQLVIDQGVPITSHTPCVTRHASHIYLGHPVTGLRAPRTPPLYGLSVYVAATADRDSRYALTSGLHVPGQIGGGVWYLQAHRSICSHSSPRLDALGVAALLFAITSLHECVQHEPASHTWRSSHLRVSQCRSIGKSEAHSVASLPQMIGCVSRAEPQIAPPLPIMTGMRR